MKGNVSMNEQKDFFPATRRTLKYRRRLVIGVYALYVLDMLAWWLVSGLKGTSPLERLVGHPLNSIVVAIPLIVFLVCVACYLMLFDSIRDIARAKDKNLDERQRMVRDRAYRYAYRVTSLLFLLSIWYFTMQPTLSYTIGMNFPLPNGASQGIAVFFGAGLIVWTLPTSIIAWTEVEV